MAGLLDSPSRDEYLSRRASEREAYFAKRAEMRRNGERDFTGADAARFAAEMTPILGDAMAVKELWEEATSESPNWGLVGLLGGTAVLGLIPGVGDAAAKAVKAGAQGLLDTVKRVEVDPDAMGSLLGNVRLKPKGDALSPARRVADLLASGRVDEVTDEMLGKLTPNDKMELFELYESGATGMDLPMDTASRLARASEQEYAGDYFHGSNLDFLGFDRSTRGAYLTDSPAVADSYVGRDGGTIYPALVRGGSDFPVVQAGGEFYSHIPLSGLPDELGYLKNDAQSNRMSTDEIVLRSGEQRLPGVIFEDVVDPGPNIKQYLGETVEAADERLAQSQLPSDVINVGDPRKLRSKFARFDPRLAHLRDLSAGLTIIPGGLLTLQEVQKRANEEQQRQGLLQ